MREIKIVSVTGSELISTSTAKAFMKVDFSDDDTIIGVMITAAHTWCENYLSKDIIAKQRIYYVPKTTGQFDLPFAPIASIDELKIDGVVSTAYSTLGINSETIELNAGETEKVQVKYTTTGLTDSIVKQALLQLVATYYDNRADFEVGAAVNEVPTNITNILSPLKAMYI